MKKTIVLLICLCSFTIFAQDTTKATQHKRKIHHEIGINATLLLRQAFGSSSSGITPQPYNLTYKLITGKWAARVGLGISISNTNTLSTSYNENNYYSNPPDRILPNTSNSASYYFRGGVEYRIRISRKLLVYGGIDIVGQSSSAKTQTSYMNNNLPNGYDYQLNNSTTTGSGFGAGPIVGIQFYCTRRFSIYTEIPLYYMKNTQNVRIDRYENTLYTQSTPNYFYQTHSGSIQHGSSGAFSIAIPATLYFAVKF